MRILLCWSFLAVLLGLCRCNTAESPRSPTLTASGLTAQRVVDSLDQSLLTFRLPEALRQARRWRPWFERSVDSIPASLRIRLYQALSELHTLHNRHFDSISYYTEAAAELLPPEPLPLVQARQLYVRAYGRTAYDRTWADIMMTADLGIQLLEKERLTDNALYAKLLITRGIGGKKYYDTEVDSVDMRRGWRESAAYIARAVDRLRNTSPAWERFARTELAFLSMRLGESPQAMQRLVDTIGSLDPVRGKADSLYVLAYYHFYGNRPALAYPVAEKLGATGPDFYYGHTSSADYIRYQSAVDLGKLEVAIRDSERSMTHFGCCPTTVLADTGATCSAPRGCANYASGQATIRMLQYRRDGRRTDLDTAFLLSQWALSQYELNFRNEQEESALNVMRVLGKRLLSTALEAAFAMTKSEPTPQRYDALFQTMERGKSLLLRLDVQDGISDAVRARASTGLRQLRVAMDESKERYLRIGNLPIPELQDYYAASQNYEANASRAAPDGADHPLTRYSLSDSHGVSLEVLQGTLSRQQAVLLLSEAADALIALYVDAEVVTSYRIDRVALDTLSDRYVAGLVASLRPMSDTAGYYRVARALYTSLLGPSSGALSRRTELMVSLAPSLQEVPLSALMDGPDHFLIDRLSIRYIPSWRIESLHAIKRGPDNHDRDSPQVAVWIHPQLESYFRTLREYLTARGGARLFRPTDDLAAAGDADIIHLSVHARGNPARLHDNYLYFSPTDSLNGLAIGREPLNARLVVLAACSTARGYANPGEGTFSLQRSFHLAGVPDVISSVYDIPADASSLLIEHFYREMAAGATAGAALRSAQLSIREGKGGQRYTKPGYWAGIILG